MAINKTTHVQIAIETGLSVNTVQRAASGLNVSTRSKKLIAEAKKKLEKIIKRTNTDDGN